jgi:hypothetical protein
MEYKFVVEELGTKTRKKVDRNALIFIEEDSKKVLLRL